MAGALRKTMVYLGLAEDDDRYDDDEYATTSRTTTSERGDAEPERPLAERPRRRGGHPAARRPAPVARLVREPEVGRSTGSRRSTRAPTTRRRRSARTSATGTPGDHEPHRHGRRRRQASRRLRRRPGLRAARLDRAGHEQGLPALARPVEVNAGGRPARGRAQRLQPELSADAFGASGRVGQTACHDCRARGPALRRLPLLPRAHRPRRLRLDPDLRAGVAPPGAALLVAEPIYTLTEPPLRALRKVIPSPNLVVSGSTSASSS